jgi:hypothetical protein
MHSSISPCLEEGEDTEVGLKIFSNHIIQNVGGKTIALIVCPKCGSFNSFLCPTCKTPVEKTKLAGTVPEEFYYECRKCKKQVPWYIRMGEGQLRQAIYVLGYQTTVEGKNVKQLMFIKEDGSYEMSDDFNYSAKAK